MATVPVEQAFVMHSARAAIANGMTYITKHVEELEGAVIDNPGYAFDLSKAIIESTCKHIMVERGYEPDKDDNLPKLFKATSQLLPFLPSGSANADDIRESLHKTLTGMSTAVQGICELRNACGFASHGSSGPRTAMESTQALLAAQAADAIVGFMFRVHKQSLVPAQKAFEYSSNPDFNDWIDERCDPVKILNLDPYRPSEVLYNVDKEAYHDLFAGY